MVIMFKQNIIQTLVIIHSGYF